MKWRLRRARWSIRSLDVSVENWLIFASAVSQRGDVLGRDGLDGAQHLLMHYYPPASLTPVDSMCFREAERVKEPERWLVLEGGVVVG